jgi:aminoglycoside 6'-N-acetyltransferase I
VVLGTGFLISEMTAANRTSWAEMRAALWPSERAKAHAEAIEGILSSRDAWGLIAEDATGAGVGFAEIAIRKYANGCETQPVPFLEGVWVKPMFRRRGVGAQLIGYAETVLASRGFRELGSDTELHNRASQAAHTAWGFTETERVVYFRKELKAASR